MNRWALSAVLLTLIAAFLWALLGDRFGNRSTIFGSAVVQPVTRVNSGGLPGVPGAPPADALPLLITSTDAAAHDSLPGVEGPDVPGGRLIVRWSAAPSTGNIHLGLLALVSESGAAVATDGMRWQLGPYADRLAVSGAPVPPDGEAPRERRWTNLPAGTWQIVARPTSDVVPVRSPVVHFRNDETHMVDLSLVSAGRLWVRVELPDGEPVAGAQVRVVGPLPSGLTLSQASPGELPNTLDWRGSTDGDGQFQVNGVTPGTRFGIHAWTEDGTRATGEIVSRARVAESEVPDRLLATPAVPMTVHTIDSETLLPVPGVHVLVADNRLQALSGVCQTTSMIPLRMVGPTDERGMVEVSCEPGSWVMTGGSESGYGLSTLQITDDVAAAREITVLLDRIGRAVLRVATADGTPVPEAKVTGSWWAFDESGRRTGDVASVSTDSRGEFSLDDLGELPSAPPGGLSLFARHEREGSGGLSIALEELPPHITAQPGQVPWPLTIVIQPAGSLELQFAPLGWPVPSPPAVRRGGNPTDRAEADELARSLSLTLRHLGSSAAHRSMSMHHGEHRRVLVGMPDDEATATFEDLEPGCYAVAVSRRDGGLSFTTPPLWVDASETTTHWVTPPRAEDFGTVTLDVAAAGHLWDAIGTPNTATLLAERSVGHVDGGPFLQTSIAGEGEARRMPIPESGRVVFEFVPPGRYTIGMLLPDAEDPTGARVYRTTEVFDVGPGEQLLLRTLEDAPVPPGAAAVFTESGPPAR